MAKPITKAKFKKRLAELLARVPVDKISPRSMQTHADLVKKAEELYSYYIRYTNVVIREKKKIVEYKDEYKGEYESESTVDNIRRLTSYKDEYIG